MPSLRPFGQPHFSEQTGVEKLLLLEEPPHLQPSPWAASPGQLLMNLQCGDSVDVCHPAQTLPRQDFHPSSLMSGP